MHRIENIATPRDEVCSVTKTCRVVIGIMRARKSSEIQLEPRKRATKQVDTCGILRCLVAVSGIDEENCRVAIGGPREHAVFIIHVK